MCDLGVHSQFQKHTRNPWDILGRYVKLPPKYIIVIRIIIYFQFIKQIKYCRRDKICHMVLVKEVINLYNFLIFSPFIPLFSNFRLFPFLLCNSLHSKMWDWLSLAFPLVYCIMFCLLYRILSFVPYFVCCIMFCLLYHFLSILGLKPIHTYIIPFLFKKKS